MGVDCPNCGVAVHELVSCDSCQTIGCVRCIVRHNRQWVCGKCKSGNYVQPSQSQEPQSDIGSALSAMFG